MTGSTGLRVEVDEQYERFRLAARGWLDANVPADLGDAETDDGFARHRRWEQRLLEAGYSGISWPTEFGGVGGDLLHEAIFTEEYERAEAPKRITRPSLRFIGPTIMRFGTSAQQERWLARMLRADDIWSQGFSEPDAGSDLAAIRTRADLHDGTYLVTGQKTWNTYGRFSDWLFALVRTGKADGRHRGLTCLAIDMHSPGIEVRPIRQVHGRSGFAEVFLDGVMVPAENRIGDHDDGWAVAMRLLSFERGADTGGPLRTERRLAALAGDVARDLSHGRAEDAARELGSAYAALLAYRAYTYRQLTSQWLGDEPGQVSSSIKLFSSRLDTELVDLGVELFGDERMVEGSPEYLDFWHSRASRIYGGTAEIQHNIVADRVLRLPR